MKKVILIKTIFCCMQLSLFSVQAQTLFGTTIAGGRSNTGAIIKYLPATNDLVVARSTESIESNPRCNLVEGGDGKLYGTTENGGSFGHGAIFSFDPVSSVYTKVKDFNTIDGVRPIGSLMLASDGKLYGVTFSGGISDVGVIFSFDPSTSIYTKVLDFNFANGSNPIGNLIQASNGKLYGITYGSLGGIFSFDPVALVYTQLRQFSGGTDGATPWGSLMQASDGKLYGTTSTGGGTASAGVLFSFDPASFIYTKLREFKNFNGAGSKGSLVQAPDGKLYGVTQQGGPGGDGVIFSFDPATLQYTMVKDFNAADGNGPYGSLVVATDGKLYGTTYTGGKNGLGVIFSFDPASSAYVKLKDLDKASGHNPYDRLMQASNGLLYGATYAGGRFDKGVIFSFSIASHTYKKLKEIGGSEPGISLSPALMQSKNGKLYGMTTYGGRYNSGVIFSMDPYSAEYKKLLDFTGVNGAFPNGSLIEAGDGKVYGMTHDGGINGRGVIFSFDLFTSVYTKLKDFDDIGGRNPAGSLMEADDGKLYGMTESGGSSDLGVIFSFDPSSQTYTKLKDFNGVDGAAANGNLIQSGGGRLFGMTLAGGSNNSGVIFSFDPSSSTYTKLKDFDGLNGSYPNGSLVEASNGKLYGTTSGGGSSNFGVIFHFDPVSSTYKKLKDFDIKNGASPRGSLMQASDGILYGMTSDGGKNYFGAIFSFNPASFKFTKLKNFDGANGAYPAQGCALIEAKDTTKYIAPEVTLNMPSDSATYLSGGNVYLTASASDADGSISKVSFYRGSALLHTVTDTPYTFIWQHVPSGNYLLTAKATDNMGLVKTSAAINISVVLNKAPTVNIITPSDSSTFIAPANMTLKAAAEDIDGRVTKVEFYNGSAPLVLERKLPYTYDWANVSAGTYAITARATDNWGAVTISAPVTVIVTASGTIVSSRPSMLYNQTNLTGTISLQLAPNPAKHMVNIYAAGLKRDKQTTLSVISATGVIIRTLKIASSDQTIRLDVSSLAGGVYTIKILSGNKVMYKKLVKL